MIPFHSLTFSVSRKDCFQLSRLSDGMLLFLALSLTHFIVTGEGSVARFVSFYTLFRRRQWHPTPVLLPGKSHGQRSLVGCSPWGHEELDTTERLHFTFHFHALEKEMATYSSVLAWRIPGTGSLVGCCLWGRTESDKTEAT